MKVYLAASWSRKAEIKKVADVLRSMGVQVTSRWLDAPHTPPNGANEKAAREGAMKDIEDVQSAQLLVRFTDDLSNITVPADLATGSRMFEMGMAYALGKPIVVVGGKQPVFDALPNIIHVKSTGELIRFLSPVEIN